MLQLSEEQLRQTLHRASQIAQQQDRSVATQSAPDDFEAYLRAAEEGGIAREAMWQALQEQFLVPMDALNVGEVIFAPSEDHAWYPASVVRREGTTSLVVEFLKGGQQSVARTDIRALALIPGRKVQFEYDVVVPGMRGIWHTGKVAAYDPTTLHAQIAQGIATYSVPLSKLRLQAQKQQLPLRVRDLLLRAVLIAGSIGIGIGFLLGHFLR